MDQFLRITDDVVVMPNEAIQLRRCIHANHAQAPPVALEIERDAAFQDPVQKFVDVLPQLRCRNDHASLPEQNYADFLDDRHQSCRIGRSLFDVSIDGGAEPRSNIRAEGAITMRFMSFVKAADNQGAPPQALIDAMGQFIEQSMKAGTLIDTGGVAPASASTRVRLSGGRVSVLDGPFSEAKELVGGYAVLECASKETAIEVAKQFLELHRTHWPAWEGECEIRQASGPND